jgi:rhomboid protease GluP
LEKVNLMISPTTTEPTAGPEEWTAVGLYPNLEQAYEHGLVVLAMGEACRVTEAETVALGGYELHAEPPVAAKISLELETYARETAVPTGSHSSAKEWKRHAAGWEFSALWVLALISVFYWQGQDFSLVERAASSSVRLIGHGEWWRPFTALFLHADLPHLAGNLVGGVVFATLVARAIGPLLGWVLILSCGTLGNALVSRLTYPEAFVSLGASAAVFAALGILSGLGMAQTLGDQARLPWLRISAPFLAGLILLGWLGGGGSENTDVLGHVLGFGSGLVVGITTGVITVSRAASLAEPAS